MNVHDPREAWGTNHRFLGVPALLLLAGCVGESAPPITEYGRTMSPDGSVEAYAYEYSIEGRELTQVVLAFREGCGAGSAAAFRTGLSLGLRWVDDGNLEVSHPPGVEFQHNASGDVLRCHERQVRVRLVPRTE